ncbi:MAG: aminotransferase class I/II-fold pyridoxal phosphate-dependent enzyme [Acidobacteria bacterium]|nr:aminotransferase class I/II-fold pyridoxal phosphate-dependent enzyme [Acidobacteriota bacterium]
MRIETFAMERMQSTWENLVDANLSESGVHPMTTRELLGGQSEAALLDEPLAYTQSNGTIPLRERIAALYPGTTPDQIQVTNGGSEANFVSLWQLVDRDAEVVMMTPNYMQGWGLVRGFGGQIKEWKLRLENGRWTADIAALEGLVTPKTRVILICAPNNPTGARFDAGVLKAVAAAADRVGAWVLSDEIYRGAELDGQESPSIWGLSDRVIVTSGLSKAYGLPGLRIGWIVSSPEFVASTWERHDYVTIAPGAASDLLARMALEPERRARIIARTRRILNENYPVLEAWMKKEGCFEWATPDAGAICYMKYDLPIDSLAFAERLRDEESVLVVPGAHFGMEKYLRVGFGENRQKLDDGLARISRFIARGARERSGATGAPRATAPGGVQGSPPQE